MQPWLRQQTPKARLLERGPSWKCCECKPGRRPFSRRYPQPSSAKYQGARARHGQGRLGKAWPHCMLAAQGYPPQGHKHPPADACRTARTASCLPPCLSPTTMRPVHGPKCVSLAHGRHSACMPLVKAVLGGRGAHWPSHMDQAPGNLPTQPAAGSSAPFIPAPHPGHRGCSHHPNPRAQPRITPTVFVIRKRADG